METSAATIFIDVDDTLVRSFGSKRIPIGHMVEKVRALKEHGASLYCWSTGGGDYARSSAEELGIADCFIAFLPKPRMLIDDVSFRSWKVHELHPAECSSMSAEEILTRLSSPIRE